MNCTRAVLVIVHSFIQVLYSRRNTAAVTATTSLYGETLILGAVPSPLRKEEILGPREQPGHQVENDAEPKTVLDSLSELIVIFHLRSAIAVLYQCIDVGGTLETTRV
ncbi:hypothetical protein M378DRAFT_14056 [Amanita muscaria Koide BX008]|uniref:Secreted protein n=1 Tax=Amanita muscaria (strain Koide BX008) TaxID=946122 RepID=A0A0C2SCF3_AMAMK|nr:hypothetical protein M378DRAFT_14056 [Amanita muscaria Koide BX008]